MIYITNIAQNYLSNLLNKRKKLQHIKISIKNPGTNISECKISYINIKDIKHSYIIIYYIYFNLYINCKNISYLKNSKIDVVIDNLDQQLVLIAPHVKKVNHNVKNSDFDNKNVILLNEVKNYIEYNINPILMQHSGKITFINITQSGYVKIQFLGSCNGCLMSQNTLHNMIERKILNKFPQLMGVIDITQHDRNDHSFY